MPFLRKPEILPVKGINLAVPQSYLGEGYNLPQNMQYFRGEMKKRDGKSYLGDVSLGAQKILHLDNFLISTGSIRLIRHTKKNVQKYNPVSGLWEDITGVDFTGSESDFISTCVVTESDLYLMTNNRIDAIRKYNDAGVCTALGGSPPKASFMDYITPYVMLGYVQESGNDFPTKVRWCDTGQPEVWTGGNSGSQLLSDDPSFIRQVKKLRDSVMVYKELSIYRGRKVSTSSIFDFGGPLVTGKGLYGSRAIASDGENHYYMGLQDFHSNNGLRIADIGKPVREYIFNRLNRSLNNTCHAIHVEQFKEIWFFITISGLSWPSEVWKYNYENDFWYFDTVNNAICGSSYKQTITRAWNDAIGSWDAQTTFWDDEQGGASTPRIILGHDTGFCSQVDSALIDDLGVAVDARLETKDYTGIEHKGIEYDTRWLQFDVWAKGDSIKFYYSIDYGSTWVFVDENELTQSVEKSTFYFDVIAPHIRFRMVQDGLSKNLLIRAFSPYFLDAGEIKQ